MSVPSEDVTALLLYHHSEYQKHCGRYITVREFAKYIGIHEKEYSAIYHKKRKFTKEKAEQFAKKFDDLRFYDAAEEARPDETVYRVNRDWDLMPDEYRKQIKDAVEKYMIDKFRE